jgi:hypothetical protein
MKRTPVVRRSAWRAGGAVTDEQLQNLCRDRMCLHLEQEMVAHVLAKLNDGAEQIPVIGCDARTGVPVRQDLSAAQLSDGPITSSL